MAQPRARETESAAERLPIRAGTGLHGRTRDDRDAPVLPYYDALIADDGIHPTTSSSPPQLVEVRTSILLPTVGMRQHPVCGQQCFEPAASPLKRN